MGFLDNLLSSKKENIKGQRADKNKPTPTNGSRNFSRPLPPLPQHPPSNANRPPRPQPTTLPTTSSIFGSLKRFKAGVASSVSKKPPPAENGKNNRGAIPGSEVRVGGEVRERDRRAVVKRIGKENVERAEEAINFSTQTDKIKRQEVESTEVPWDYFVTRRPQRPTNQQTKPKRPVTVTASPNLSARRGQHKEGQVHSDNLSRTSSVTNLDSLESNYQGQGGKGAKPRKAASKEIIDKAGHDAKKGFNKNNNKLEPPVQSQPLSCSSDSIQDTELQHLRKQLREMADEKSSLALQLGEQKGQLNVLQKEIQKLKSFQEESNTEMERLAEENTALRNRLRDVAHSPLSDNEKQQLLFESRHHSSAPASIATNVIDDNGGEATTCTTPDWDKHSSSNVSEVSVACLQDKINQMQETHYSTNEELQATLQELTDLQRQLTELQQENERLNEEKSLMFDSLCRQTERLNDSREEVEGLKQMLYRERSDENGVNQFESVVEREQRLVELLKSAQEEREALLLKLEQVQAELHESRAGITEKVEDIAQLTERVKTLECSLDAKNAEHKQLDQELSQAKDHCSGKQIEINRLTDLLENARTKINELEQDRALSDKSELDELLDNARKEKDQLESEVAYLKEQLARSKNEIEKLKEQVFVLQEECKVTRNNAKTTQSDLEYKCEKLVVEKNNLNEQIQQFQEAVNEFQVQVQCHLEDKRQLSAVLSETQRNLSEAERRNLNLETDIEELNKLRAEENEEWEKFQSDLLTSVRVANDFKTEAQQESQKIILENKAYRDRVRLLENQLEKLKGEKTSTSTQTNIILSPQIVSIVKNIDPTLANRLSWESPSSPVESMEKLFPILKRSKSRDTLNESGMERSRSREKLDEKGKKDPKIKEKDGSKKEGIAFLKRNKSSSNIVETDGTPTKKEYEVTKPTKSSSRTNISSSNLEFKLPVKKREKSQSAALKYQIHRKTVSTEEETLLKSLDDWYSNIDQNLPDALLSKEDKAVKKLKMIFEDDCLKTKPIAKKPKEQLAISKPLMNSVVQNPRLKEIIRNPMLPIVENQVIRESALEEVCSVVNDDYEESPFSSRKRDDFTSNLDSKFHKSKSVDNLNIFEENRTESELAPVVYRNNRPKVNNPNKTKPSYYRMSSDINPNDSVSNPRYSSKYFETFQPFEVRKNDLPKPNIYINYENLNDIVAEIPKNVPFEKLTEEQKFAVKLKKALDEAERKTTLKRIKKTTSKSMRGIEISTPTMESVEKNWKLKEILLNPRIKSAKNVSKSTFYIDNIRHSTDISSDIGSRGNTLKNISNLHSSKSYDDISFSFVPENTLLNLYLNQQTGDHTFKTTKSSDTSSSFTSAEFNLDTGRVRLPNKQYNILSETTLSEDLLYNDTITKIKNKNKIKAQHSHSVPNLLEHKSEKRHHKLEIEEKDPKIMEVSEKYQNDLKALMKTIEVHELRKSLRKPKYKVAEEMVEYQMAEVVEPFTTEEYESIQTYVDPTVASNDITSQSASELSEKFLNEERKFSTKEPTRFIQQFENCPIKSTFKDELIISNPDRTIKYEVNERLRPKMDFETNTTKHNLSDSFKELTSNITFSKIPKFSQSSNSLIYSNNHVNTGQDIEVVKAIETEVKSPIQTESTIATSEMAATISKTPTTTSDYEKSYNQIFNVENTVIKYDEYKSNNNDVETTIQNTNDNQEYKIKNIVEISNQPDSVHLDIAEQALKCKKTENYDVIPEIRPDYSLNIYNPVEMTTESNNIADNHLFDLDEVTDTVNEVMLNKVAVNETSNLNGIMQDVNWTNLNQNTSKNYENHGIIRFNMPIYENINTLMNEVNSFDSQERNNVTEPFTKIFSFYSKKTVECKEDGNIVNTAYGSITSGYSSCTDRSDDKLDESGIEITEIEDKSKNVGNTDTDNIYSVALVSSPTEKSEHFSFANDNRPISPSSSPPLPPPPPPMSPCPVDEEIYIDTIDFPPLPPDISYEYQHYDSYDTIEPPVEADMNQSLITSNTPEAQTNITDNIVTTQSSFSEPYDYNSTLKENRYGVVSPLNLRHTYRTVVKEYKRKFPQEDDEELQEASSDISDIEYQEDFIDDFFKPVKPFFDENNSLSLELNRDKNKQTENDDNDVIFRKNEDRISQIDNEMKDILENYLHTRTSLILKKTGVETSESKSNLKKYDNIENLQDIVLKDNNDENIDNRVQNREQVDSGVLSPEELSFIAEMKEKYGFSDPGKVKTDTEARISFTENQLNEKMQRSTKEESNLSKSIKADRKPRPLSEFNEKDFELIQQLSKRYGEKPESNIISTEKDAVDVWDYSEYKEPKLIENIIINHDNNLTEKSIIKKTEYGDVSPSFTPTPKPHENVIFRNRKPYNNFGQSLAVHSHQDTRNSKRLSDLIFTETIVIPHSSNEGFSAPKSPLSPVTGIKPDFKQTIVIPHTKDQTVVKSESARVDTSKWCSGESKITFNKTVKSETSVKNVVTQEDKESRNGSMQTSHFKETIFIPKQNNFTSYIDLKNTQNISSNVGNSSPINVERSTFKELIFIPNQSESRAFTQSISSRKPLPAPRSKESSFRSQEHVSLVTSRQIDGSTAKLQKFNSMMKSNENFSENPIQESKPKVLFGMEFGAVKGSDKKIQDIKKSDDPIEYQNDGNLIKKYKERVDNLNITKNMKKNSETEEPSEVSSSQTITVSTKLEQLDLRKSPPTLLDNIEIEETSRQNSIDASNLNLFKIDSNSSYESYIDIFKSKESRDFDALIGKKKKGFALMTEYTSDSFGSNSYEDDQEGAQSMPKVVDFIPMDDNTTPYFTKSASTTNYDTLEREKTFQVLEQASQLNQKSNQDEPEPDNTRDIVNCDLEDSMEALLRKSSSSHTQIKSSRASFNQAKKLFEALAEANKDDRPKTVRERRVVRTSLRDSKSFDHVQMSLDLGKPRK